MPPALTTRLAEKPFDLTQAAEVDLVDVFWPTLQHPKQTRFVLNMWAPYQLYVGGIRSGKTWSMVLKAFVLSMLLPNQNGLLGGRVGRDLVQTLMPQLRRHEETWLRATGWSPIKDYRKADQVVEFYNGHTLLLRPYDQVDRLRGIELSHAGVDEPEYASDPAYAWDTIAGRMSGNPNAILYGATTPKGMRGVVGKFARQRAEWEAQDPKTRGPLRWVTYHSTIYDNPFLEPSFIEDLKTGYSPRTWRQEGLGEVLRPQDVYLTEYDPERHLVPWRWRPDLPTVLGVDWGTSAAAAALVQVCDRWVKYQGRTFSPGTWIVADELVVRDTSYMRFRKTLSDWIDSHEGPAPTYMSPDRAIKSECKWLARHYRPHGSTVKPCFTKREQSIIRGLEILRYMLDPLGAPPRLYLADSLQSSPAQDGGPMGLRDALANYSYERGPHGELTDSPSRAPDDPAKHIIDAVRMPAVKTAGMPEFHGGQKLPFLKGDGWADDEDTPDD